MRESEETDFGGSRIGRIKFRGMRDDKIQPKDLVVSKESSSFDSREISYLESNFIQLEFDVTHMKNPLSLFTDLINNSIRKFMDMAEFTILILAMFYMGLLILLALK